MFNEYRYIESIFFDQKKVSNKILSKSFNFYRNCDEYKRFRFENKSIVVEIISFFPIPSHLYYSFVQMILLVKRDSSSSIYLATVHQQY